MTSSTNSGASSMAGRPGVSASATPAITSTIEGAVLSRRAITAAMASTARNKSRIWMVAVMPDRLQRAGRDVDGQCQQGGIEDERNDAVGKHGAADRLAAHGHIGDLRAHADDEGKIEEVHVVGLRLLARKLHAAALGGVLVIELVRVVQREHGVRE